MSTEKNTDDDVLKVRGSIEDYINEETGLSRKTDEETLLITDYVIENDKVRFSAKLADETSNFLHDYKYDFLIGIFYALFLFFTARDTINLILSVRWLDKSILDFNYYYFVFILIAPILVWLLSTNTEFWNYHNVKFTTLSIIYISITIRLSSLIFLFAYDFFVPWLSSLDPTPDLTTNMIVGLGYILIAIPTVIGLILLLLPYKGLLDSSNRALIEEFKLKHHLDLEGDNPYRYNMSVITNMKNGKKILVKEHDRYMHTEATGATGTAKTSSCILPTVNSDLKTKIKNEDAQKKILYKMIKEGKVYLTKPLLDEEFAAHYFKPNPGYEKEFEKKILKYRSAGLTAIAPDDSLTDNIYDLCVAKKIKCNRIDPKPNPDGTLKEGFKGFNPLYISPSIPEWARKKEIIKRATLFADVMQIIYEMSGKSDPYFSSINRIATTTISILLSLTYPLIHNGKQPTPKDVQTLINDFNRINQYYEKLLEIDTNKEYMVISDVIKNDFLGPGQVKFEDHCRGLRVQLNNFLMDPLVENVLCVQNSVDLDAALANGEVTVCNIELGDLGPINSPAFGLFFSISFLNAVLRRPGNEFTRLPHFCYIDELPVIISPSLEACFSLFRKFRVAMFVALQTFDQMNKNPFLQYLKGVIINSCAHHIVFGRANPNDMDLFSQLAGVEEQIISQVTYSQTSISVENPSFSESERTTPNIANRVEPSQIREKDFQEVTFFTVDQGRPLNPIHGRVFFLRKKDKKPKKRFKVDWEALINEQTVITKNVVAANKDITSPSMKDVSVNNTLKNELAAASHEESSITVKTTSSNVDLLLDRDDIPVKTMVESSISSDIGNMHLLDDTKDTMTEERKEEMESGDNLDYPQERTTTDHIEQETDPPTKRTLDFSLLDD